MFPPLRFSVVRASNRLLCFVFASCFFSVFAVNNAHGQGSQTFTRTFGGIVTTQGQPAPDIPLIVEIRTGATFTYVYEGATTDSNGYYSVVGVIKCDDMPGFNGRLGVDVYRILENGDVTLSIGFAGNINCANTNDWSNSFPFSVDFPNRNNPQEAGQQNCNKMVGEPINVTTGNMYVSHKDYSLPTTKGAQISLNRSYNSDRQRTGLFGFGWSSELDESLWISANGPFVRFNGADGRGMFFGSTHSNGLFYTIVQSPEPASVLNETNGLTLMHKDGRTSRFDTNGKILWKRDRNGNQTTYNYNSNGAITGMTDPFGRTLTITLNGNGMVSQISDSLGVVATYEYFDSSTLLKTVTYQDGSKYKFEYETVSGKTFLKTVKDALDKILETHEYDGQGRARTSEVQGGNEKYELDYSTWTATSPYTSVKFKKNAADPLIETKFYFDRSKGRNVITKTEGLCGCGGGGNETTEYEYDGRLNLVKIIDANLGQTTYAYDDSRNLKSMTDVFGTQKWTHNSFGQVLTYQDRIDSIATPSAINTIVNTYDGAGNLKTSTNSLGHVTTIEYPTTNNKGLPDSIKDARNNLTKFKWFSTSGLLQEIEDAVGKKTTFTYDARGRTRSTTNPLTETTLIDYFDSYIDTEDNLPRSRVEVTYPNSEKMTYRFDRRRLMDKVTDDRGKVTKYEYDSVYRLIKITDPLLHVKEFDYDLMSNLKWSKDALGNQTDFKYDDFNRLKEIEYPAPTSGGTRLKMIYKYDLLGRIEKVTDTAGRDTVYTYNTALRENTITNPLLETTKIKYNQRFLATEVQDARPAPNSQIYTFGYDAIGRLITETRAGTTMSYEYDQVNNLKKRTDHSGRISDYTYDNLNRLTKIEYDGGANNPLPKLQSTYGYDDLSRLISATNESGTVTFGYDNRGRLNATTDVFNQALTYQYERTSTVNQKRMILNGTLYASYNYDDDNRLLNIVNAADSTTIGYTYYADGMPLTRTYPNGVSTTYLFDNMRRIKRLTDTGPSGTLFDREYGHNSANQISQIVEPSSTRMFGYDNADRLTSVTGSTTENYVYDKVGNRESSHLSSSYVNALFNRVTSTQTATYSYDANGNTTLKSEGKEFWRYSWDHENKLTTASTRKSSVRYKYDALGRRVQRIVGSSKENTKFTYEGYDVLLDNDDGTITKYLNGPGIDNKLRSTTGSTSNYFLADHLGSTNGLTNSSGALTASNNYDSFGNPTNSSFPSRYQFTGREYDGFSVLQYSRARFYDPKLGRFVSEDPIGFAGGDYNLYGYVHSNAVNKRDPLGLIDPIVYQDPRIYPSFDGEADDVQTVLGICGLIPGIGEICDLVDGAVSYARCDYVGAGLSAGSMVPFAGWGAGATKLARRTKKYANSRPPYAKGQVEEVWENAKTPDGKVWDPISGEEIIWDPSKPRNGQWDMGHKDDMPYKKYHDEYNSDEITLEEFKRRHRDSNNYRPQTTKTNRGWRKKR